MAGGCARGQGCGRAASLAACCVLELLALLLAGSVAPGTSGVRGDGQRTERGGAATCTRLCAHDQALGKLAGRPWLALLALAGGWTCRRSRFKHARGPFVGRPQSAPLLLGWLL